MVSWSAGADTAVPCVSVPVPRTLLCGSGCSGGAPAGDAGAASLLRARCSVPSPTPAHCEHLPWDRELLSRKESRGLLVSAASSSSPSSLFPQRCPAGSCSLRAFLCVRHSAHRERVLDTECCGVYPLGSNPSLLTHRGPPSPLFRLWGSAQQPCRCPQHWSGLWPWAGPQPLVATAPQLIRLLTSAEASGAFCVKLAKCSGGCGVFNRTGEMVMENSVIC